MKRFWIFLGAFLPLSSAAYADWEFTRWGMTPDEVKAAANEYALPLLALGADQTRYCNVGKSICLAVVPNYKAANLTFDVSFAFENGMKLDRVVLSSKTSSYAELNQILSGIYGSPVSSNRKEDRSLLIIQSIWRDTNRGNMIKLNLFSGPIGSSLTITYSQIVSGL
jgi:hypothetical protein